jgi:tetraacyldisaccharide 4'-kinase
MNKWLAHSWCNRGLGACLLWPLSLIYQVLSGLHRKLYRVGVLKTERCPVPLVVVGNVVTGGAGKTPLVIALVQHFMRQGLQVGVVSRGYGRRGNDCLEVLENTPLLDSGDEPALILRKQHAPVFIANRRIEAVNALLAKYPATQIIISDDGLQHHRLARDIDIIVFDDRGIGNGWLLPAGPLRQPYTPHSPHIPYTAAQQNQSLVLHTGQSPAFKGYVSMRHLADYALTANGRQVALSSLQGQTLTALAGIANPQAFFDMLSARGLQGIQTISLPDHFDFSGYTWPVSNDAVVLCTEKDAVKLFKLAQFRSCNLLAVPLEFSPEPAFLAALDALLSPLLFKSSELTSPHEHPNGH